MAKREQRALFYIAYQPGQFVTITITCPAQLMNRSSTVYTVDNVPSKKELIELIIAQSNPQ